MLAVLEQFILEHRLVERGDIVCAGLSGGADSVCMVRLLHALQEKLGFELRAFHVDHHLRGSESTGDQMFVRQLCRELEVPLTVYEHPVSEIAAQWRKGLEETGRILRRQDAERCLEDGCSKIALAHHRNDRAETLLFNLARGCSIRGLTGIRPVNGPVIHPLLCFKKEEILEWMTSGGYDFREDASNRDTVYTRNYIREHVIPDLEDHVNRETVLHFTQLAEDAEHLLILLEKECGRLEKEHVLTEPGQITIRDSLLSEDSYLVRSVLLRCLGLLSGRRKDLQRIHADDLVSLFHSPEGARLSLPYGITAERFSGSVRLHSPDHFQEMKLKNDSFAEAVIPLIPGTSQSAGGYRIRSEWISDPLPLIREKNPYTKCFDYDIINKDCVFRTRRPGDRMVIDAKGHTRKLKDYMIGQKIPRLERDTILLMASGNRVHWVIGGRISEDAKVTDKTKRILAVTAIRENYE